MLLSTIILHTVFSFTDKDLYPKLLLKPGEAFATMSGFIFLIVWIFAFIQWLVFLREVSSSLRNMALLYGVMAANGGPIYMLLRPGSAVHLYVLYTLLPMYLGMAVVSFSVFTPEMLLPGVFLKGV
jgi:hypothetical protein